MLFSMAFVAVSSIALCVGGIVMSLFLMPVPSRYIVMSLLALVLVAHVCWLYHILGEIYVNMPKKRPRKRSTPSPVRHRLIALVVLEILAGVAMYILYSNAVIIPAYGMIIVIIICGLTSLLF